MIFTLKYICNIIICLFFTAPGEHSRPAVGHQAAVYEVPEGAGYCGGWPAAGHTAAHAQNPPLLNEDELPQRGHLL